MLHFSLSEENKNSTVSRNHHAKSEAAWGFKVLLYDIEQTQPDTSSVGWLFLHLSWVLNTVATTCDLLGQGNVDESMLPYFLLLILGTSINELSPTPGSDSLAHSLTKQNICCGCCVVLAMAQFYLITLCYSVQQILTNCFCTALQVHEKVSIENHQVGAPCQISVRLCTKQTLVNEV